MTIHPYLLPITQSLEALNKMDGVPPDLRFRAAVMRDHAIECSEFFYEVERLVAMINDRIPSP